MKRFYLPAILVACMFFSGCETAQQIVNNLPNATGSLTNDQIVQGLKEALTIGTQNSSSKLSAIDGYFANAAIKILLPPEAQKVESTLRSLGLGSTVDKAVLSLNRAAEDAAKSAAPIFVNAIKQMTITDALGILKGGNNAATNYFKGKTTAALTDAFKPTINAALSKVSATKYWTDMFTVYNKFATTPVNTDLSGYVTGKAIDGIFFQVSQEEAKIRTDPAARVTDILKKVFGSSQAKS
ncbi:Protein of unknown function [Filimonas lacunae]|uniref:DUF4197 domain-containing protein n=1 Tax=Filimonas lacunae TaxID=477680 RepID=A0A173MFE0_9BACT|nr:DUF4197 domain-containing protein [Filimonas lacunae]BAV06220.1 hypothetical protein FLA_2236 [Filimonas lacunae]SIT25330.1 Protein of unknown function [Filimonas lacunae]